MSTTKTVTLDTPIVRGDSTINSIDVRKPQAGELRGVNLTDVLQLDVNALIKVLPRVTTPTLTDQELRRMDPADFMQLGNEMSGFLLPKSVLEEVSPSA
ncbi:phage tail assembly protein [Pseudomonas sp. Marseille-Q5115]|uniref:phage tail assembly protein n=1 Tax=Pseudomonas sp. Marseille-Q5115 TaxID=2866593 RepID=UPI001CE42A65|nr:phage tail assembly protein [Pseudomonas sp. Marseille-Q5115]